MKAPIKNYIQKLYPGGSVTQWFGENPDLYAFLGLAGHNGIDIVAPYGTPILAPCDMIIADVKYTAGGYGRHIRAIGGGYEMTFGHLSKLGDNAIIGHTIKEGDVFCFMGNSGFVVSGETPFWKHNPYSGTHLHFGIRPLGGRKNYVDYPTGRVYIKNYPGDYKGAVDPAPLITWEDIYKMKLKLTIKSLLNQIILLLRKIIRLKYERNI